MLNSKDLKESTVSGDLEMFYVGTVEDHADPLKLGRLRVRVPEIYGDIPKEHLPWANPATPFGGGKDYGIFMIPIPGAKVRIRLWRGHPWTPEWYGAHWFEGEVPKEGAITPPENYVIKTPKGHIIDMHDGQPYIRIKDQHGNFIIINTKDDDISIYIKRDMLVEADRNLDETIGKSRRMKTGEYLDEKIGSSERKKATANIDETAGTNMRHKAGVNFDVDAGATINLRGGGTVNIQGGGSINVLAGGSVSITGGGLVNILGGGAVNIDGASVNIMSGAATPASPASPGTPSTPQ